MKQRRTKQAVDPTAFIEICLSHWARWARVRYDFGLGFPSETRENKLRREGVYAYQGFQTRLPDDKEAEKTEQAICEMPEKLKEVVMKYYLQSGSVSQKANELDMSRVTFHEYLRMAKYWLLGKWS